MNGSRFLSSTAARWLALGAVVLALVALGGTTWLGNADTAIAPEPARLTVDLAGSTGATAAAVYTYSNAPTTVLKWPSGYTYSANPPAVGTPCSTGDIPWGTVTYKVIQGGGSYRRCY